jgi:TM2 domain-containing membrane protein YozV
MADETQNDFSTTQAAAGSQAANAQAESTAGRTGFCQDCGRPLTAATTRNVGSGVFCEPCLMRRVGVGAAPSGSPAGGASSEPYQATQGPAAGFSTGGFSAAGAGSGFAGNHLPNPNLAGFLGLIPGVGAMYNGQFAKGIAHLVIFFILTSLSDHVNGGFGILVAGWVFYQAFEAYHTAKARLHGTPLPNPFGLNDIGDRMGFGKAWSATQTPAGQQTGYQTQPGYPVEAAPATPWAPAPWPANPTAASYTAGSYAGASPDPAAPSWAATPAEPVIPTVPPVPPANWAGYVPPSTFAQTTSAPRTAEFYQAPYASTPYVPVSSPAATAAPLQSSGTRFPVAAIVLIGLGVLALLQTTFRFDINGSWITALGLAAAGVAQLIYRLSRLRRSHPEGVGAARVMACAFSGPSVLLLVLAALFALQAANLYTLGQTWAVIVIAFGAIMLAQRAAERAADAADEPHSAVVDYGGGPLTPRPSAPNPYTVTPQPTVYDPKDEAGR